MAVRTHLVTAALAAVGAFLCEVATAVETGRPGLFFASSPKFTIH